MTLIRLLLIAVSVGFSSCGLQDYVYLEPPVASNDGNSLQFSNATDNDPSVFLGFKIVYKFYASEEAATEDRKKIVTAFNSNPTAIYSTMKSTAYGYRDLIIWDTASSGEKTSLNISNAADRDQDFTISIDFSGVSGGTSEDVPIAFISGSVTTEPALPSVVYRDVTETSASIGFSADDLNVTFGYSDLGTNYTSNKTYVQFYIFSYGINLTASGGVDVYSKPEWFSGSGNIDLTISDY